MTDPGLTAMLAVGLARYVGHLVPLSPWGLRAVAAGSIIALAAVNALGGAPGSRVLGTLAALEDRLAWVSRGMGLWAGPRRLGKPDALLVAAAGIGSILPALGIALVGAFIAFAGWWDVSKIAGEVRDPSAHMPRALILGVSIVTLVYIAVSVVFLYLVPPARIVEDDTAFAALAGDALFGRRGEVIFSLVVVISAAGSLAAVLMAAPRVYFAMARDRLFFASFGAVDPRRDVPARATAVQATLAVAVGTDRQLRPDPLVLHGADPGVPGAHGRPGSLSSSAAASDERSTAPPGYPLSPLLFLIPMVTVILLRIARDPVRSSIGLLVVVCSVFRLRGWVYRVADRRQRATLINRYTRHVLRINSRRPVGRSRSSALALLREMR